MSDTNPRAVMGGNNPPEPISDLELMLNPAVLRDQLELDYPELVKRKDDLVAGVDRLFKNLKVIETIEQQARAGDFVRQMKLAFNDTEVARVAEVAKYLAAQRVCQKFFKAEILDPLERGYKDVEAKMTVFQRAEDKRIAEEQLAEKKRLQEEADKLAAAAIASERPSLFEEAAKAQQAADAGPRKVSSTVRGTGSSSSLRTRYTYEEIDLSKVPPEWWMLDHTKIQRAIDGGLRDGPDGPAIPGLKIVDASKVVVRG